MNYIEFKNVTDFSPEAIFDCGQCFRWVKAEDGLYKGVASGHFGKIEFNNGVLKIHGASEKDRDFWTHYLDLERDYGEIKKSLKGIDPFLDASIEFGGGIRILNQEFFETLISFILSANNNIPRIRGCVENTAKFYGKQGDGYYSFPDVVALSIATEEALSDKLHAGYRCRYIVNTCKQLMEKTVSVDVLKEMTVSEARKTLCSFMGVGGKVADCILLFSGVTADVFPVDVWVKRVMEELYFKRTATLKEIEEFSKEHFGSLRGFAQQYLFYYAREHMDDLRNMI
ncbi:MAG: DNA-3-methyladenine glycosylase 2 [Ruminococcaceae bacterium]|nr:DNA-3-methyladenine glycosylase 2 [Oscillospiraceae bacterium]